MARMITAGAAQLGPIARSETRPQVVKWLVDHLRRVPSHGCDLVVFPELCLTTFAPRCVALHRQPQHSRLITERPGTVPPPPE